MTIDQTPMPTDEQPIQSEALDSAASTPNEPIAQAVDNSEPVSEAVEVSEPTAIEAASDEPAAMDSSLPTEVAAAPSELPDAVEALTDAVPIEAELPQIEPEVLEPVAEAIETQQADAVPDAPVEVPTADPAPPPSTPQAATAKGDEDLFAAAMRQLETGEEAGDFRRLSKGERVEATVIQVDRDRVFVDLGTKSEGIVPLNELTSDQIEHANEHVQVGDKIHVIVLRPENREGNAIVSKRMADFDKVWDHIISAFEAGEMVKATVIERVKGGLVVDIGVRGFVPATHVGMGKLRNIEKYVGQQLDLKIIELDRDRKKVVLSNREAEEVRRKEAKEQLFVNVKPGDIIDGTVRRLTDYGAFVDLGGVDGLLHISEMSWMRINHPREVLKEGQKIKVMVLRIDGTAGKVSLGHRQVLPDPWNLIRETYTQNQRITVKIGRLVQSGAFVKLPEGAEAFLPLSEISNRRLRKPDEAIEEGQDVEVQIIDLRPDERRMVLSIRAIAGGTSGADFRTPGTQQFDDDDMRKGPGGKKAKKGAKGGRGRGRDDDDMDDISSRRGFTSSGATIGERLGLLKGFKIQDLDEDDEVEVEAGTATDTHEADVEAPVSKSESDEPAASAEAPDASEE
jgi:4-hydroxy-3-methylbut-2-enyl diphosphate reductase